MSGADRPSRSTLFYRHSLVVRITHWVNVLCVLVLLMSGLQIFNAHPALYWGDISTFDDPILAMRGMQRSGGERVGVTEIFDTEFETTGVLGLSAGPRGEPVARGFPSWSTLPSYQDLASGRRWHFFFAWLFVINGLVYIAYSLASGHWRQLIPTGPQLRGIGGSLKEHLLLRFHRGEEAKVYNVLQKLAYVGLIVVILPGLIIAGLNMSPGLNAAFPWLVEAFGGRQSARTIHFIAAALLILFIIVHVVMVLISGVWNNMRSMITGRYRIHDTEKAHAAE